MRKAYDDADIIRQLIYIIVRANVLIITFSKFAFNVELQLFISNCTTMYCSHLWAKFTNCQYSKMRFSYKRRFLTFILDAVLSPCSRTIALCHWVTCGENIFTVFNRGLVYPRILS